MTDPQRVAKLFEFDYTREMYKPARTRVWGWFALPILHGGTLIGKLDAGSDYDTGRFPVHRVHEDAPFSLSCAGVRWWLTPPSRHILTGCRQILSSFDWRVDTRRTFHVNRRIHELTKGEPCEQSQLRATTSHCHDTPRCRRPHSGFGRMQRRHTAG
jgi:hypothetical protein